MIAIDRSTLPRVCVSLRAHFGTKAEELDLMSAIDSSEGLRTWKVAVLGTFSRSPETCVSAVRLLREQSSQIDLLVCLHGTREMTRLLRVLAVAGADDVFDAEHDADHGALIRRTSQRLALPAPQIAGELLSNHGDEADIQSIVRWCLRNGFRNSALADVERLFQSSAVSLTRRLMSRRHPTLRQLLRLSRVGHADALARSSTLSIARVASLLDFPSASALNMARYRLRGIGLLAPSDASHASEPDSDD